MDKNEIYGGVKKAYGKIAEKRKNCGCGNDKKVIEEFARTIGYQEEDIKQAPDEANLGLGCGSPVTLANLTEGERVLDLGSGAGFDCFIAAGKVGETGMVMGVDMTHEMVEKAKENAKKNDIKNVEFRLGEIESLPLGDNSVDVVISNCVINLSSDKAKIFEEIFRVLKPEGRIAISDIALIKEIPKEVRQNMRAYVGCVGGAILIDEYKKIVSASGLKNVAISIKGTSNCITSDTKDPIEKILLENLDKDESLDDYIVSISVKGYK